MILSTLLLNQPYWLKKNPSLLSYKGNSFKTLKKNALVKKLPLLLKGKSFRDKRPKEKITATAFSINCLKENSLYDVTNDIF